MSSSAEYLFPNLTEIDEDVIYIHDGTHTSRSLLGIGAKKCLHLENPIPGAFTMFESAFLNKGEWVLTCFAYDLKNAVEELTSNNDDGVQHPSLYAMIPRILLSIERGNIEVLSGENEPDLSEVLETIKTPATEKKSQPVAFLPKISKDEYLEDIKKVQQYLQDGDIYEMNYCQEFYAKRARITPFEIYERLHQRTLAPFSGFIKIEDKFLMCGSPERFLSKRGNQLLSQPIKGTKKRGKNKEEDERLIKELENDPKERGENIMIVDLVRNDLSKTAIKGSVKVEELCAIHSFKTVHQMISTVVSEVSPDQNISEILASTFPMGSMTGVPKIRAMEIIEELEHTKRGMYSGAFGYFTPDGDFDLNVVIRSICYNRKKKYLSAMVGGAITIKSDPNSEYDECLLKAEALFDAVS